MSACARWWRRIGGAAAVIAAVLACTSAAQTAPPVTSDAASEAPRPPTHQPLRQNQPPSTPEPTEPETFTGDTGAPPYTVVPRKTQLALFPCSQCHSVLPVNPVPRKLVNAPHAAALAHGKGRMWCLDCHLADNRDSLHTINGTPVDFDQSYQLCGQCHSARQRDWTFGAHGKRVAGWTGARELYSCTHCHDPHRPQVLPRAPGKAPPVRAGLAPMPPHPHQVPPLWQRLQPGAEHAATGQH